MEFEFDFHKSEKNRLKHGITLAEARVLWEVPGVEISARTIGEPRFLRISPWNDSFYSCVFTLRGRLIRLISARRSSDSEIRIYKEIVQREEKEENEH